MSKYTVNATVAQYLSLEIEADTKIGAVRKFREMYYLGLDSGCTIDNELISICCGDYEEDGNEG